MTMALGMLLMALLCGNAANAVERKDSAAVTFGQSRSNIELKKYGNGESVSEIIQAIDSVGASFRSIRGVHMRGGASPEGSALYNMRLSAERARVVAEYIKNNSAVADSLVSESFVGRDWQGLRGLVENDDAVPCRSDVLALLDEITTSDLNSSDYYLARLKTIGGGAAYRYMYAALFPSLRATQVTVEYAIPALPRIEGRGQQTFIPEIYPVLPLTLMSPSENDGRPFYMGLKSNLLYDALALPSIGAEFYLGKNWSVVANWTYGWWDSDRRHRYWRAYGGDVAVRRWFGTKAAEKPLTGHHVGVYAGMFTYDFEWGGTGYMGGRPHGTLWDRCHHMVGVEYGYSLPVGSRINIDFTVGVGYMGGEYMKYKPKNDIYVWESTHRLHWFGPTKAEVSLVWLIGNGNVNSNKAKGGNR